MRELTRTIRQTHYKLLLDNIEGDGSTIERLVLDRDEFRLMAVNGDGNLTLNNTTLSGGLSDEAGGALYNYEGTVTISNSISHTMRAREMAAVVWPFFPL
jgi:hypothetical protein